MAGYMVIGMFDCPWFAKACLMIEQLTAQDPYRKFTTIPKDHYQWQELTEELYIRRGWMVKRSPVIWEILIEPDGKGNLIGDVDDFCEYARLVFGFISHISTRQIEDAVCKNKANHGKEMTSKKQKLKDRDVLNIAIIEPPLRALELLLTQLLSPFPIWDSSWGLNIKVHEKRTPIRELQGLFMEVQDMAAPTLRHISSALSAKQCVHHAHLVIIMEDFSQDYHESTESWLQRINQACTIYADAIRMAAAAHCKLLIGCNGPICHIAEIFRRLIPSQKVPEGFIATIGQHVVNGAKGEMSRKAGIPSGWITRLHAWGWPGMTGAWVEVKDALVTSSAGSGSIQGPKPILRPLSDLATNSRWIYNNFPRSFLSQQKRKLEMREKRMYGDMSLADAVLQTLQVWFASEKIHPDKQIKCRSGCSQVEKEEPSVSIPVISVGIPCASKSGFPQGTFMVQPGMCYMGHWMPTGSISDETSVVIHQVLAKLWTARQFLENPEAHIQFLHKYPHLLQSATMVEDDTEETDYLGEDTEEDTTLGNINDFEDEEEENGQVASNSAAALT